MSSAISNPELNHHQAGQGDGGAVGGPPIKRSRSNRFAVQNWHGAGVVADRFTATILRCALVLSLVGGISANAVPIQAQENLPEVTYGQMACFDYATLAEQAFWQRQEGWGRKYVKSATLPYPPGFPVIDLVYAWPLTGDTYTDRDAIRQYITQDCARAVRVAEEEITSNAAVGSADDLGINYIAAYTCRDFGTMAAQAIAWRLQGLSREGAKARTVSEAAHPIIDLAFSYPTTGDYLHDANRFGTLIVENCSIVRGL